MKRKGRTEKACACFAALPFFNTACCKGECFVSYAGKKENTIYSVHALLCLLIMFGFGRLPAVSPLTQLGMQLIGIFFGLLYGWIFVGNIWPSLAGLLALMLVVGMKPKALLNSSFGDPIVVMMFFIFIFCATINYYGLSKLISVQFISNPIVAGRPWLFTLVFLSSIALLGGLTSSSPAVLIGWNILYSICNICGYQKGDAYPNLMIVGTVFAGQLGMSMVPFKQLPLTVGSAFTTMSNSEINYVSYMLLAISCCLCCLLVFVGVGKYVLRLDVEKLRVLDVQQLRGDAAQRLTLEQKLILTFLLALVLLLLLPNFLSAAFPLTIFLKHLGNTGICILVVTLMCAIRVGQKPLLQLKAMADAGIAWGIILLLAVVQPLSAAMRAEESGITAMLLTLLEPVFGGRSPILFVLMVGLIAVVAANFMNVGAVGVALMPVVCSYCGTAGIDPQIPAIMVILCVHLGLMTPAASTCAALLHGNAWVDMAAIWKNGLLLVALSWVVIAIMIMTLGQILFSSAV